MSVDITVRGTAERRAQPERATIHVTVESEGGSRDEVFGTVRDTAATLSAQLSQRADEGAAAEWSSEQLRTWSFRPWEKPGRQGTPVHHAQVEFRATFTDFATMTRWLSDAVLLEGANITHVDWALSDGRRDELVEQARGEAVAHAVSKANSYARSLGLGDVRPAAIADAGMLGGTARDQPPVELAAVRASFRSDSAGGVAFTPQDVVVTAAVDARFVAG